MGKINKFLEWELPPHCTWDSTLIVWAPYQPTQSPFSRPELAGCFAPSKRGASQNSGTSFVMRKSRTQTIPSPLHSTSYRLTTVARVLDLSRRPCSHVVNRYLAMYVNRVIHGDRGEWFGKWSETEVITKNQLMNSNVNTWTMVPVKLCWYLPSRTSGSPANGFTVLSWSRATSWQYNFFELVQRSTMIYCKGCFLPGVRCHRCV